jgi:hypothetical protein
MMVESGGARPKVWSAERSEAGGAFVCTRTVRWHYD